MRSPRRMIHLLLAAFLLASSVSVAAHYSAHAKASAEQCLLCASHAGANTAATAPEHGAPECEALVQVPSLLACPQPASGHRFSPPSRGPPIAS